jgi:uncharacterized membrane protein (DUF106 family)
MSLIDKAKISRMLFDINHHFAKNPAVVVKKKMAAYQERIKYYQGRMNYYTHRSEMDNLALAELEFCEAELKECQRQVMAGEI